MVRALSLAFPAKEAVTQLAFIAPSLQITPSRGPSAHGPRSVGQAGTHSAAGVELSDGTRSQKAIKTRVLVGTMGPRLRRDGEKK